MEVVNSAKNLHENSKDATKQLSNIREYFSGKTVFVTGATGFLGKLLVEKLLRTCTNLGKIYILMRPKKDKNCEKRFEEYFDNVIFEPLKRKYPKALEKVFMVSGDCSLPDLGLSEDDQQVLISEVNCLFHLAATVRFDEKIWKAAIINVKGTKDILTLARKIKNLSSFVYVSTTFSFCPRKEIEEKFYKPKFTEEQLMTLVDTFTEDELEELTPRLLGEWPNTYSFTKSIAEDIIRREGSDLPFAVVRPSIVASTFKEPLAGWIDNFYGLTGIIAGAGLGVLQTLHCKPDVVCDTVPADYVVNCFIAAAWEAASSKSFNSKEELKQPKEVASNENLQNNIPIYNYVSSPQNPLTFRQCFDYGFAAGTDIPSTHQLWHQCISMHPNKYVHLFFHYLLHIIPAHVVDFFARCFGKTPQLVKLYTKVSKFMELLEYFTTQQWTFSNKNTQELWNKLSVGDKIDFEFDIRCLDWESYFDTYIPGLRVYLVNDSMDTLPQARARSFRLKVAHYTLVALLLLGFVKLLLHVI